MSMSATDRIRAMQEKGALTAEQAEELLSALSRDAEDASEPEDSSPPDGAGTGSDGHAARQSRPHCHSRSFLDRDWVGDMVDGITTGLGVSTEADSWDKKAGKYAYVYQYDWDRHGGRHRHDNGQDSSRVESPEGEAFEFKDNHVVVGRLCGLRLVRSRLNSNTFSAASLEDAELTDSSMEDCSLSGASLHELRMSGAVLKDVRISGAKLSRLLLESGCSLEDVRFLGGKANGLALSGQSRVHDTHFSGAVINDFSLSRKTQIEECRFAGATLGHLTLDAVVMKSTRLHGCSLDATRFTESELADCTWRGMVLHDSELTNARLSEVRIEGIIFERAKIQGSSLKRVVFRDTVYKSYDKPILSAANLSIIDSELEGVSFIDCRIHDTTIQGIKAKGIRLRGVDLAGKTITSVDELKALAS